ncbi:nuclear receptor coactivator 5-like isoform X2 [Mercenaria mercenaria]|uniref:nuclear receptor coactivator 5-like isoform X2 n=1 Tax=Mercenaria mercenaria TaxID=6596 RepID=UPI001E1E0D14|nr:nuclear receptor coactivator 5-like isoform X2 [Mercenaria mercenaria]
MVRTRSRSTSRSRSRSRSRSPRERIDRFGRVIPPGKKRSMSRSPSRSRDRFRRRTRSPVRHARYRSRSRTRSRSRESRNSSFRVERRSRSSSRQFREKEVTSRTNIEDPAFLNARIFIGKLPSDRCSKEELEELFVPYGKILGVSIHDRGFGFVQFEKEEDARKAQEAENGTKFKGQVLDVKMAAEGRRGSGPPRPGPPDRGGGRGAGPASSRDRDFDREPGGYPGREGRGPPPPPGRDRSPVRGDPYEDRYRDPYARREPPPRDDPYYADPYRRPPPIDDPYRDPYRDDPYRRDPYRRDPYDDPYRDPYYRDPYLPPPPPKKPLPADVQVICMNKQLSQYAESIEARLRTHALIVDIVVITEDMTVPQMVEEASRMKFLFAIIINSQNETHKSLTLNILHGTPQEHRNMPLEDAMKLVATSFEKYIQTQREKAAAPTPALPGAAPAAGSPPFLPPSADIAYLLNLLADNRQLTIEELGKVIDYLKERKEKMMINEGIRPQAESVPQQRPAPTGVQAPSASAGDSTSAFLQQQQQELQNKILNILNGSGSSVASSNPPQAVQAGSGYAGVGGAPSRAQQSQSGSNPLINFDNPNVQKALDNLIQSGPNLLKSLPSTVTQSSTPRPSQYQPNSQQSGRQQSGYPGQQGQQGSQGAQAGYGGSQYGQFQQQSPMQGLAAPRAPQPAGYGAQQQRGQLGARAPQPASRPRY